MDSIEQRARELLGALEDLCDVAEVLRGETAGDEGDRTQKIATARAAIASATAALSQGQPAAQQGEAVKLCDNPSGTWCKDCRGTGLSHCSDPINCGGMKPMRHHASCPHPTPPAQQPSAPEADGELYYVQDSRTYCGNSPMWWGPNGRGYVTRLDEAGKYARDEAMRMHRSRSTDVPWRCDEIDGLARPTVDMQHMRRLREQGASVAAAPQPQEGAR